MHFLHIWKGGLHICSWGSCKNSFFADVYDGFTTHAHSYQLFSCLSPLLAHFSSLFLYIHTSIHFSFHLPYFDFMSVVVATHDFASVLCLFVYGLSLLFFPPFFFFLPHSPHPSPSLPLCPNTRGSSACLLPNPGLRNKTN